MSRIKSAVADEVFDRSAGYCECCGGPARSKMALHHRLPLSAGGKDEAVNLMFVHGDPFGLNCHNLHQDSIHQNPARSYRLGHLVRRGGDPATVPVIRLGDDPVLSSADA